MIAQVLAAAVGTVAFALLFGVPRKYYFYCGLVGGAGWLIYVLLTRRLSATETEAIFFATLGVILLCRVFAVREECPVTVFMIAGIFPLVPGTRIYWTAYYAVTDQLALAQQNGFAALKDALAIVLGIVVIFELPGKTGNSSNLATLPSKNAALYSARSCGTVWANSPNKEEKSK